MKLQRNLDGRSRCFTCSSAAFANDKIGIFWRRSVDLVEIIRSAIGVDELIDCSESSDLFLWSYMLPAISEVSTCIM